VFYKVQSTTLSSQTLDVVWVERIQIYQVLAPGLTSVIIRCVVAEIHLKNKYGCTIDQELTIATACEGCWEDAVCAFIRRQQISE